jgi:membrane associated rhomboid family serine protease
MDRDDDEEEYQRPQSPFHALPPLVVLLTLAIVGIEAVLQLANYGIVGGPRGVGWRIAAIEEYGFSAAVLDRVIVAGDYSFDMLKRFVTYPFINGQLMQVAFCAALTLALGKFTSESFGPWRMLFLYLASSIAGAIAFGLMVEGRVPLYGGFAPVFGLIGAYTYSLWLTLGKAGENRLMAFRLIGFLLTIRLVFGLIFGSDRLWIAEIAGFVAGFLLATLLAPGGWRTLVARLRERS